MPTDREALVAMLGRASARYTYQKLDVTPAGDTVTVYTGPDDAVAVFQFSPGGQLATVMVNEC